MRFARHYLIAVVLTVPMEKTAATVQTGLMEITEAMGLMVRTEPMVRTELMVPTRQLKYAYYL